MNKSEAQSTINQFILILAESSYSMDEIKSKVEDSILELYKDGNFRHSYSQIFATIKTQILPENKYDLDFLSMNIETLYNLNNEDTDWNNEVKEKINKLCDHIMLETSRMGHFNNQIAQYKDLETQLKSNIINARAMGKGLKNVQSIIDSLRSESVTVLSILSAIMLAGLGGFTVLGNIALLAKDISNYEFFIIASFLGLILFNVVFMLIYMVARLTGKNIYTICTDNNKSVFADCQENDCSNRCCGLNRVRKRLPYIFWSNLVLIVVIVFCLISEYLVMKYSLADWLLILLGFIFIGLSLYYGMKNSRQ